MGLLLLGLFLITLAYLGYFLMPGARRPDAFALGRVVTSGYLALSTFFIAVLIISSIGFPGASVHKLVRHIEFRGVAVTVPSITGDTSNVRITSNAVDNESEVKRAFRWFGLPAGAWIDLRPDQTEGKSIRSYRAEAHGCQNVVRLNRVCVNDSAGGWIKPGEKARFQVIRVPLSQRHRKQKSSGEVVGEFTIAAKADQVEVNSGGLSHETTLVTLVDRASLRDVIVASGQKDLLATLIPKDDLGDSILDKVQVVRYVRRDGSSAIGLVTNSVGASGVGDTTDPTDTYVDIVRSDAQASSGQGATSAPAIEPIDGKFRLDVFGSDSRNSLALPATADSTTGGHAQLRFLFDPPREYPLPPAEILKASGDTIQLASADLGQEQNGYLFDTGNLNEGFLATAILASDGTSLAIGNSVSDTGAKIEPNESQVLGSASVAPIYALADPLSGKGYPWLVPVLGLVVGAMFCVISFTRPPFPGKRRGRKVPVNIAPAHTAFVLWVIATAILAVRVVLAFRVSTLPPFNMDAVSALSFHGTWIKALVPAAMMPPLLGLLTMAVVRAKQPNSQQPVTEKFGEWAAKRLERISHRPWHFLSRGAYGAAGALALLMFLQKLLHFPFPDVVLLGVLLVVLGLVFDGVGEARDDDFAEQASKDETAQTRLGKFGAKSKWLNRLMARKDLWEQNPLLWLASCLLFILDPGTFLFFIPLAIALCVGGVMAQFGRNPMTADPGSLGQSRLSKAGLFAILGMVLFGIAFSAPIGSRLLTNPVAKHLLKGAAFPYRLAATDPVASERLLADPETKRGPFDPHHMQETLHQRWEMIAYQRASGVGYFGAPLSNVGMTYPTTLSDAAFSVYLVAEHGLLAGAMVIGLLLLLALAVFRAAWLAASSRNQRSNARGLYALGGVFGCASIYMALANLWVIPFTGQNVPLLSLNSWKDLILNGTLLVAAILLIAYPGSWSSQPDPLARKDARRNALTWWAFPCLLGLGWVVLCFRLVTAGGDPSQPYNLSNATLTAIKQTIQEGQDQTEQKQVPLAKTAAIQGASPFIRTLVANYDSGEISKTPIVEARGSGASLSVDKKFFLLRSPFEKDSGVAWHGSELGTGKIARHELVVGGSRVPIVLESGRGPMQLILGRPVKASVVQAIDIKQVLDARGSRPGSTVDYGGIKLDGDRVMLRWKNFGKPGAILVNGKKPDLQFNELEIKESDIVSLEYTGLDGVSQKLSLHYLGPVEAKLATVVWRNGRFTRNFPQGADFPLAYTIGEIGDELAKSSKKGPVDLQLSLDMQLQRDLQTELRSWARSKLRLVDHGAPMPDGLPFTAVSVLDSHTGQIRAIASLPQVDPREELSKVEERFSSESDAQVAARSSWTLVNRTIGSTIKPLGFSALNSQLDSKSFDLTKLHVSEAAGVESYFGKEGQNLRAYRRLGDIHLKQGKGLGSKENPRDDVDMFAYLKDSRTWPAIVTSTIGLVADKSHPADMKSELAKMLSPSSGGPISMGGQSMAFTPGQALHRLFSSSTTLSSIELADTAYFRGIQDCYGPSVVPFNINEANRWDDGLEKRFLAPFDLSTVSNLSLKNLGLPAVHWADTTSLTDLDGQLIRYMIGGGECRWNAVAMAANFARITTGKKIQPTLSIAAKPIKEDMPAPISSFEWRSAHIISPLTQITTIPGVDVTEIRANVAKGGYRIAMKTGTIDDGMGKKAMESEMLMFTVGKYNDNFGFVPGQSISGFFSIRSAKRAEGDVMVKGDLIKRVMPILTAYLKRIENEKK